MKKTYIKPAISGREVGPVVIMAGSVTVKTRIGISSFRTDTNDWYNDGTDADDNQKKSYKFWD